MSRSQLNAAYYRAHSQTQSHFAEELIRLHHFKHNERILDIGCGHGALSARLAALAPEGSVLGIDPSQDMICYAKSHYLSDKHHNLSFALGSAEDFHGNACYSLITLFNCLHWVRDVSTAFHHLHQALLPNGRMLALTYPADSEYWGVFTDILALPEWTKIAQTSIFPFWLSHHDYLRLSEQTGFNLLNTALISDTITYAN